MFKDVYISLVCRIICLLTFIVVIFFIDNLYTLAILSIIFFIMIKLNKQVINILLVFLYIMFFLIGYFYNNYFLLRLLLICSYIYYFFIHYYGKKTFISNDNSIYDKILNRNKKKLLKFYKEGDIIDKIVKDKTDSDYELIKDKIIIKNNNNNNISMNEIFYVLIHLLFLFFSIMIGACVI